MSNIAIQVENLSKRYRIGLQETRHETITDAMLSWMKSPFTNFRRLRELSSFREGEAADILWALKDLSFTVNQGEVIGVIGHNGAGKSTLLKILSRITPPTGGRILLNGRVASLLEVGTGFHPELTGRENVYLNGTILGMRKTEIDQKFDEIVDFSGVEKFIDTPVKRYSSGMRVRLAFSVAAHLEPEILLVDEVLAVGDAAFQQKSLGKMGKVARAGRTVLLVSHNMAAIESLCQKALWLKDGQPVAYNTDISGIIQAYLNNPLEEAGDEAAIAFADGGIVREVWASDENGQPLQAIQTGSGVTLQARLTLREQIFAPQIRFFLHNSRGVKVATFATRLQMKSPPAQLDPGSYEVFCRVNSLPLVADNYHVSMLVHSRKDTLWEGDNLFNIEVHETDYYDTGRSPKVSHGIAAIKADWTIQNGLPV
ncbi:MAG: ABC transporter ATP-binding protein [Anaerolineales bacterium]|nr:ABC transporter ATP-binding protein [Anaerolineales bacterium]